MIDSDKVHASVRDLSKLAHQISKAASNQSSHKLAYKAHSHMSDLFNALGLEEQGQKHAEQASIHLDELNRIRDTKGYKKPKFEQPDTIPDSPGQTRFKFKFSMRRSQVNNSFFEDVCRNYYGVSSEVQRYAAVYEDEDEDEDDEDELQGRYEASDGINDSTQPIETPQETANKMSSRAERLSKIANALDPSHEGYQDAHKRAFEAHKLANSWHSGVLYNVKMPEDQLKHHQQMLDHHHGQKNLHAKVIYGDDYALEDEGDEEDYGVGSAARKLAKNTALGAGIALSTLGGQGNAKDVTSHLPPAMVAKAMGNSPQTQTVRFKGASRSLPVRRKSDLPLNAGKMPETREGLSQPEFAAKHREWLKQPTEYKDGKMVQSLKSVKDIKAENAAKKPQKPQKEDAPPITLGVPGKTDQYTAKPNFAMTGSGTCIENYGMRQTTGGGPGVGVSSKAPKADYSLTGSEVPVEKDSCNYSLPSKNVSKKKAKKILKDGKVHGKKLTEKQRKMLGAAAGK